MNDDHLRESLLALYEQAPCGYIFTLPDGTLARVNQTFLAWTGYTTDELVPAVRLQDLLTMPGKMFYENQYDPLLRIQGFVSEVAFDLIRKDRTRLPVLVSSVRRADAHGRPVLTASTVFEATHRRRYEQELLLARRRAEELADIVTHSTDAIVRISPRGDVESWNDAAEQLFGLAAQDAVGWSLGEILCTSGDPAVYERIMHALCVGRAVQIETTVHRRDRQPIDVSIGLTPHTGLVGEVVAASLILRDISERRAAERLQQEFLAMASHELKNPLAAIRGNAQLLQRRGSYSERSVSTILAQSDQLRRLIDDLLLASQIEANRLTLHLTEIDLVAEARLAADGLSDEHPIRVVAPSGPLVVPADPQRLRQVFANLLANAVKYSPAGGEIVTRVRRVGADAQVAVEDRGVGIPAEAIPHLFDRFFRADGPSAQAEGLGLGLYITRRIVEAHGGSIRVESERGRGSTFTVSLPLAPTS